jgi:hypothetical protein
VVAGTHIVTHEYIRGPELALFLGDRIVIVDNGDPDWLHGFKVRVEFNVENRHSCTRKGYWCSKYDMVAGDQTNSKYEVDIKNFWQKDEVGDTVPSCSAICKFRIFGNFFKF